MKLMVALAVALSGTALAAAQTPGSASPVPQTPSTSQTAPRPASPTTTAPQSITMTGCVGSLTGSQDQFMLSNPTIMPGNSTLALPAPSGVATAPSTPGVTGAVGTSGSAAIPSGSGTGSATASGTSAVGTSGSATGAGPGSTAGTTGAVGTTGVASGAAGTASPTATAGATSPSGSVSSATTNAASTAAIGGYRLSGTNMSEWSGKRVQIVGAMIPAKPTVTLSSVDEAMLPEFRVQSVQPLAGNCP